MRDRFFELLDEAEAKHFDHASLNKLFELVSQLWPLEKEVKVLSGFEPFAQLTELTQWFIRDPGRRPEIRLMIRDFFFDLDRIQKAWYNIAKEDCI